MALQETQIMSGIQTLNVTLAQQIPIDMFFVHIGGSATGR